MPLHEEILSDALAQSVLIVGHSPFLEDWTKKITGASFDYKTGALLCIDYDPYDGTYGKGKSYCFSILKERRCCFGSDGVPVLYSCKH